ncbi:TPA: hypothetical protein QDC59_001925 [Burkholderia cenocepacia]|nr:hypothetical protein [Burkholderia cenocepacia]
MEVTLQKMLPTSNDFKSDSPEAFLHSMIIWARKWIDLHGITAIKTIKPFALVYAEPPTSDSDWDDIIFFREDPDLDLGGRIFVSSTSLADVRSKSTTASRMKELGEQLIQNNLDAQPLLIVDAPREMIFLYPNGIKGVSQSLALDASPLTDITRQTIDAELDEFHTLTTKYPDGYGHVWHSRKDGTLHSDAEAIVRDLLYMYFQWKAFRTQLIVREYQSTVGRPDISIFDFKGSSVTLPKPACVMELKVLRSRGLSKNKVRTYPPKIMWRHARMGVSQAKKYKLAEKAPLAYICLYDGRDSYSELPDIKKIANDDQIEFKHFFMEKSTRDDLVVDSA